MVKPLAKWEIASYALVWSACVGYSIRCFYHSGNVFQKSYEIRSNHNGWLWLNRFYDSYDLEWAVTTQLAKYVAPWLFVHLIVSEFIHSTKPKLIQYWYILCSVLVIVLFTGALSCAICTAQILAYYIIMQLQSKIALWTFSLVMILAQNYNLITYFTGVSDDFGNYIITITFAWNILRCLSFTLDFVEQGKRRFFAIGDLVEIMAYALYLPTFFLGPIILHSAFKEGLKKNRSFFQRRLKVFIASLMRAIFWWIFTDFSLHFIYVNAFEFAPEIAQTFDPWSRYGYGYCMGQFFHLKYVVLYGFTLCFARFENIKVPQLPRCIGRIHLYSDMWRWFDNGLYMFLIRYIYISLINGKKSSLIKIASSFACFCFVYVWHGINTAILIWSILNFVGICVEICCRNFAHGDFYKKTISARFNGRALRRVECLAATPLLALSAMSNFYFFGGFRIGNMFFEKIINDPLWKTLGMLGALYCCCQVSTELKMRHPKKK